MEFDDEVFEAEFGDDPQLPAIARFLLRQGDPEKLGDSKTKELLLVEVDRVSG